MKVGVTLPQFRHDPGHAIAAARAADASGVIDGVFVFDHLWAIGQPDRPALGAWPMLGALAAATHRVALGPLVARVSLLPDAVLAHHVKTMLRLVGRERFIAGLGVGDRLSEPENEAYGVPFPPLEERLARLRDCGARCLDAGAEVWIGGRHPSIVEIATELGVARNLWAVEPAELAEAAKVAGEVTWGGIAARRPEGIAEVLSWVRAAGATWCVLAPEYSPGLAPEAAVNAIGEAIAGT